MDPDLGSFFVPNFRYYMTKTENILKFFFLEFVDDKYYSQEIQINLPIVGSDEVNAGV